MRRANRTLSNPGYPRTKGLKFVEMRLPNIHCPSVNVQRFTTLRKGLQCFRKKNDEVYGRRVDYTQRESNESWRTIRTRTHKATANQAA